jgi:hypothetical protein
MEEKLAVKIEVEGRRGRRLSSYWMTLRKVEDVKSGGRST